MQLRKLQPNRAGDILQLKQLLKLIFINISQNKMRTFLTTLGVIVGTATIFLVVAIGKGRGSPGKRTIRQIKCRHHYCYAGFPG
ncbi:exported hypothetical protein [Desulforamulus hydrothermalis Lam5 = DSM 18033]|uniref:MacB-like periplasmic core domain-containing protein n=1 Tax=Desulforamulus hydrothermalis Lam5 = DSM 18033 TaxID=1121428 RepID=K8DYZ6_9FIRM|nr:exported hypothetical protein [Desulforamulus hydrothermalis Lam5 = DSM 18033]